MSRDARRKMAGWPRLAIHFEVDNRQREPLFHLPEYRVLAADRSKSVCVFSQGKLEAEFLYHFSHPRSVEISK
jgi:hypothetical protein